MNPRHPPKKTPPGKPASDSQLRSQSVSITIKSLNLDLKRDVSVEVIWIILLGAVILGTRSRKGKYLAVIAFVAFITCLRWGAAIFQDKHGHVGAISITLIRIPFSRY